MRSPLSSLAVAATSGSTLLAACGGGATPRAATDTREPISAPGAHPVVDAEPSDRDGGMGAASVGTPQEACLMVNVCSCNLGCATIELPPSQLVEGARTRVVRGPLSGQEVKLVEVTDTSGARVLALTDLDHDYACSLAPERSALGYGCAADKSGPVPAKACTRGCD